MPNGDNQDNADAEANAVARANNMFIKSYGLFWKNSNASWGTPARGHVQGVRGGFHGISNNQIPTEKCFCRQIGLYALYDIPNDVDVTYDSYNSNDDYKLVYCGYSGRGEGQQQSLLHRIRQHQQPCEDFIEGWNQFSWFGIGDLGDANNFPQVGAENQNIRPNFLKQIEAVMLAIAKPGTNGMAGRFLDAIEYTQHPAACDNAIRQ